jgi:hypothetical protein
MFVSSHNLYIVFGCSGVTELNHTEAAERDLVVDRNDCAG